MVFGQHLENTENCAKRKMAQRRRLEPFSGDIVNSLVQNNKDYHWDVAYKWYSEMQEEDHKENKVWTSVLAKAGCMAEVFDFREAVHWCAKRFDAKHRLINVKEEGKTLVPLTPLTFKRMVHLLEPMKVFRLPKADSFLDAHRGGSIILKEWFSRPMTSNSKAYQIEVNKLVKAYQELAWLFARVIGQEIWCR